MLKKKIAKIEDVPEAARQFYEKAQDGNGFVLKLDGDDQLAEFRQNNIELRKKVEEMQGALDRVKNIDPEKYRKAVEVLDKMATEEDKKLLGDGQIDELIARRTQRMREGYEERLKATTDELTRIRQESQKSVHRLSSLRLEQELRKTIAAKKLSLVPGAEDDLIARAMPNYNYDPAKDTFVPREGLFDSTGNPAKIDAWVETVFERAPHLFASAEGAGDPSNDTERPRGHRPRTIKITERDHLEDVAAGKVKVTGFEG